MKKTFFSFVVVAALLFGFFTVDIANAKDVAIGVGDKIHQIKRDEHLIFKTDAGKEYKIFFQNLDGTKVRIITTGPDGSTYHDKVWSRGEDVALSFPGGGSFSMKLR